MRIATFNLESLDLPPKANQPIEQRIRILRPQLVRLDADILCLQEVNGQSVEPHAERQLLALDKLLKTTKYENYNRISTTGPHGNGVADVHNLVILSNLPIKKFRQIHHKLVEPPNYKRMTAQPSKGAPEPVRWDRPVLHAEIELPDERILHIVNLHLRAPLAAPVAGGKRAPFVWNNVGQWAEGFFLADIMRAGQALEVRLCIEQLFDRNDQALVLVCGDFNAESLEAPIKIIKGAEEDTGSGALGHRALISMERALAHDRCYSVLHHGRPLMLDHILISRALLASFRQFEIHNETLEDELVGFAKTDKPPDSFHAPVFVSLSLSEL